MSTAWLQTRNNSHDVLAADCSAVAAQIVVTTAATQFPAGYPYRVTVWDAATHADPGADPDMEIMEVTGRSGNTLSVTRGVEGTTGTAHTAGDVVRLLVTAGMVQQLQSVATAHDHAAGGDGGQVAHGSLSGIGSNTHAQIDSHIGAANPHSGSASTGDLAAHTGNTSNPHAVTAAQVGNATAQWNANKVQGTSVDAAAIGAGKVLKFDGTKLVYAADNDTTYSAGSGLSLTGTVFSVNESAVDHGGLGGLSDDDHTQYHTAGRADTWLTGKTTDNLTEGATNLYFTQARARGAVSAAAPLAFDTGTGQFSIAKATALADGYLSAADWSTFNSKQPALALPLVHENGGLEADVSAYAGLLKITGGTTSYITDNSAAWDGAAAAAHAAVTVLDTASVDLTLTGQQLQAAVLPAGVDHNALLNYVANQHIDWTNASSNLLTSGTGQVARLGVGTAPSALASIVSDETFTVREGSRFGSYGTTYMAPADALTNTLRGYGISFRVLWDSEHGAASGNTAHAAGIAGQFLTAPGVAADLTEAIGAAFYVSHMGIGDIADAYGVISVIDQEDNETYEDGDIAAAYNYYAQCVTDKGVGIIGNRYGYYVRDIIGGGLCDTQYGLFIAALSGATTNRAVWLAGSGSSNGVWMGGDVNIYRNSANVLKTDDALHIGGSGITFPAGAATINGSGGWLKVESGTTLYLQYDNPTKPVQIGRSGNNLTATIFGGLTITSTTQAFIPPRMTTAQRDAIASPVAGMVVYNTTTGVLNFYNGSAWGAV